uniref:Uncharacterized protein n=1 Tax=Panagrolaimus sp. JU765 TaxID=591449 RepID=A0AC34RH86_9BILA
MKVLLVAGLFAFLSVGLGQNPILQAAPNPQSNVQVNDKSAVVEKSSTIESVIGLDAGLTDQVLGSNDTMDGGNGTEATTSLPVIFIPGLPTENSTEDAANVTTIEVMPTGNSTTLETSTPEAVATEVMPPANSSSTEMPPTEMPEPVNATEGGNPMPTEGENSTAPSVETPEVVPPSQETPQPDMPTEAPPTTANVPEPSSEPDDNGNYDTPPETSPDAEQRSNDAVTPFNVVQSVVVLVASMMTIL